jgi:hypothetical protein
MPETDEKIFGDAYEIYNKYRWRILKEEDFLQLSNDISALAQKYDWQHNPLADRAAQMLIDVFNDFYKDGRVPAVPDYFGRSDL